MLSFFLSCHERNLVARLVLWWSPAAVETGTAQRKRKAGLVTVADPNTEAKRG
jgi:hypothetical protein